MQRAGATGPVAGPNRHVRATVAGASLLLTTLLGGCGGEDAAPTTPPVTQGATGTAAATPTPGAADVTDVTDAADAADAADATTPTGAPGTSTGESDTSRTTASTDPAGSCSVAYEVLAGFPHDPTAFTQGLVVDGDVVHESTGLYGESTVRTVDPTTGEVLREVALPDDHFGEGLALLGDRLYQLTWREGVVHVHDRALAPLGTIETTGEGWGLTTDGDELVLSDGSPLLRWIEPRSWTTTRSVTVTDDGQPVARLNELEFVDGAVLANVWQQPVVAVVDPADGTVTGWLDLTELVPDATQLVDPANDVLNGVALDPATGHLFVTGKRWPVMYELDVDRSCWPGAVGATP